MGDVAATRARVRADVLWAVHQGLSLPELARTIGGFLHRAVPFDGTCLLTVDPATLLPTGEVVENGLPPAAMARLTEIELGEPDVNKFTTLAHAPVPAASLSAATGGDLDRSLRHRELRRTNGFADELRAVLTDPTGSWGALTLLREKNRPDFTPADVRFVASLTPIALRSCSSPPGRPRSPRRSPMSTDSPTANERSPRSSHAASAPRRSPSSCTSPRTPCRTI